MPNSKMVIAHNAPFKKNTMEISKIKIQAYETFLDKAIKRYRDSPAFTSKF